MSFPKTILTESNIARFLEEDIGTGDITTDSTVNIGQKSNAYFYAKDDFILAGIYESLAILRYLDEGLEYKTHPDGDSIKKGDKFCEVHGNTRALLTGERAALNLLQS